MLLYLCAEVLANVCIVQLTVKVRELLVFSLLAFMQQRHHENKP